MGPKLNTTVIFKKRSWRDVDNKMMTYCMTSTETPIFITKRQHMEILHICLPSSDVWWWWWWWWWWLVSIEELSPLWWIESIFNQNDCYRRTDVYSVEGQVPKSRQMKTKIMSISCRNDWLVGPDRQTRWLNGVRNFRNTIRFNGHTNVAIR